MQVGKIAYFLDIFEQYPIIAIYKGSKSSFGQATSDTVWRHLKLDVSHMQSSLPVDE